jgi:hypothetical protein
MLLLLALILYAAIIIGSVWAVVHGYRARQSVWWRTRFLIWLAFLGELAYMVQAPACVYLPWAPGKPAVERVLLGADGSGRLYWLEGTSSLGFAWGLRWWFVTGPHILFTGGFEVVPPLRFARLHATRWEVVRSDGWRRTYPTTEPRGPGIARHTDQVEADGTLVQWHSGGLYRLPESASQWQPVSSTRSGVEEAFLVLPSGNILEAYEVYQTNVDTQGKRRDFVLIEVDKTATQVRRGHVSIEDDSVGGPGAPGRSVRFATSTQGLFLYQTWVKLGLAEGRTYRLDPDLEHVGPVGTFDFDPERPLSIAGSPDGTLFTTGQAVFTTEGEKVLDIDPPLTSCVWVGRRLHGVRKYPFFASQVLYRGAPFRDFLTGARGRLPGISAHQQRRFDRPREALLRSRWTGGGIDEAGREDEIVEMVIP